LKGWGLDFPSSSQTVPINYPSISFCSHQVPKKFSSNSFCSHQNPLFSSITHQYPLVLIKFPKNSYQIPLVLIKFPSNSFCSHHVPIKILLFPWLWRIGRWAQWWMVRLVRDSGRVLNMGRPEGEPQW
jgi:hypothetical protein